MWCLNRFYEGLIKPFEAPQRSVTIKNELIFISTQLSGIHRTLRVNDDAQNNRGDKTLYMKVCFETVLDDERFLKWLDNTVDYKLYSLNILKLSGNKKNMRGRKTEALRHQDIIFLEQNSITSDNSINNKTRASKMLFLKQFRNIEDPQIFQKDAQFTNGSKKMYSAS